MYVYSHDWNNFSENFPNRQRKLSQRYVRQTQKSLIVMFWRYYLFLFLLDPNMRKHMPPSAPRRNKSAEFQNILMVCDNGERTTCLPSHSMKIRHNTQLIMISTNSYYFRIVIRTFDDVSVVLYARFDKQCGFILRKITCIPNFPYLFTCNKYTVDINTG